VENLAPTGIQIILYEHIKEIVIIKYFMYIYIHTKLKEPLWSFPQALYMFITTSTQCHAGHIQTATLDFTENGACLYIHTLYLLYVNNEDLF
jgi:hypothetical protein